MRRASVILVACIFALGFSAPLLGGSMNIPTVGAKAKGMGGAFRAIADDWSAGYYNPAGLFYTTDNRIYIDEVITYYEYKYTPDVKYGDYNVGYYDGDIYNRYHILNNPMAGGHMRAKIADKDVVLGLSFFQPYDVNMIWNVFQNPNNEFTLPNNQIEHNFDVICFNVVGATELIENKLSVGISTGLLKADLAYAGFELRPNPFDPAPGTSAIEYVDIITSNPNNLITQWHKEDGKGYAPNIRLGAMFKPNDRLSIGGSYSHKVSVTVDGDFDTYFYMPDIFDFHSQLVNTSSMEYILSSGARYSAGGTYDIDLDLPGQVGFGLAYDVNDRLIVAADAEYTLWSQFSGYRIRYTYSNTAITSNDELNNWMIHDVYLPVEWRDTWKLSLGAQYDYSNAIKFRCGYMLDQSPYEDNDNSLNIAFFDPGTKHALSLGLGINFENISLDFGTQYILYPDATTSGNTYFEVDGATDGIADNTPGGYEGSAWDTVIQFSVRF